MADIALLESPGGSPAELLTLNMQLFALLEMGNSAVALPDTIIIPSIHCGIRLGLPYLAPAALPVVAPTIDNISPAPGAAIATNVPFIAEISLATTDGTIKRLHVTVGFANLTSTEVAYQGDDFTATGWRPDYNGASSLVQLSATRWRITVIRNGGWPAAPRIFISASTDRGGLTVS